MGNGFSHIDQGIMPGFTVNAVIHAEIAKSRYTAHISTSFQTDSLLSIKKALTGQYTAIARQTPLFT